MPAEALRVDAARNRQLLVDAAREVFAERGLDAPLDEIARRAHVGNATLYRRFPTRCDLVAAVFVQTMRDVAAATERSLANPEPWAAFCGHLTFLCQLQAKNRALADLLTSRVSGSPELEELCGQAYEGLLLIIDRAQSSGTLRADFQHEDIVLILMSNAGLIDRTSDDAPTAWERHLSFVLAGLHEPAHVPAAASPGEAAVLNAMTNLARNFGCA